LIAMLTALYRGSGAAHFNDVATHPARRNRGLAQALCYSATARLLENGYPAVTLGMYAENHAARRVYQALGFIHAESFTSGAL
jgi:predicted GNAT family acetyltransferase